MDTQAWRRGLSAPQAAIAGIIRDAVKVATKADPVKAPDPALAALNRVSSHIYAGTVPAAVVRRRRAKNKRARISRRVNRAKAKR